MDIPFLDMTALTAVQAVGPRGSPSPQGQTGAAPQRRANTTPTGEESAQIPRRQAPAMEASRIPPTRALGPVRFEVEEGTRIAKFFDTREILIYQVPPEGQLYVVKLREAASPEGVETEA